MTFAAWSSIESTILEFMVEVRTRLVEGKRDEILLDRKAKAIQVLRLLKSRKMPLATIWPESADYCELPYVKAVIEQPSIIKVNLESLIPPLEIMDRDFVEWRYNIRSRLISMIKAEGGRKLSSDHERVSKESRPPMTDEQALHQANLAVTVFACLRCNTFSRPKDRPDPNPFSNKPKAIVPLFYPQPFGHPCMTRTQREDGRDPSDPTKLLLNDTSHRCPWNTEHLFLDERLSSYAERLVECAGLDPATATVEEMDRFGVEFRCTACEDTSVKVELYGWRAAVSGLHCLDVSESIERVFRLNTMPRATISLGP